MSETCIRGYHRISWIILTGHHDIDTGFFPGDPLVCLPSVADKHELFSMRQVMELGVFFTIVA